MSSEAAMLVVDNSEVMRNGDYDPTRWEAQAEMASVLAQAKCAAHAKTHVGIVGAAGRPEVVVQPTRNAAQIEAGLHRVQLAGPPALKAAIRTAMFALRHAGRKNERSSITLFVGSAVPETSEELRGLGALVRTHGVALDIVVLDGGENGDKLAALVDDSHQAPQHGTACLVHIPPGTTSGASAALWSSAIMMRYRPPFPVTVSGARDTTGLFRSDPALALAIQGSLEAQERDRERRHVRVRRTVDHTGVVAEGHEPASELGGADEPGSAPEPAPMAGKGSMVIDGAEAVLGAGAALDDEPEREAQLVRQAMALARAVPGLSPAEGQDGQATTSPRRREEHGHASD